MSVTAPEWSQAEIVRLMDAEPLTVHPDDLLSDVADEVKDVHYGAAIVTDHDRPVGLVTRGSLVTPVSTSQPGANLDISSRDIEDSGRCRVIGTVS